MQRPVRRQLPRVRAEPKPARPAHPRAVSFEMTLVNQRITDGLNQLADACD